MADGYVKGNKINAIDYNQLKANLDTEISDNRRKNPVGGDQAIPDEKKLNEVTVGVTSIDAYNDAITKIDSISPINRYDSNSKIIYASDINQLYTIVNNLTNYERGEGNDLEELPEAWREDIIPEHHSGCKGACTGLCHGTCYGTAQGACSVCDNQCKDTCGSDCATCGGNCGDYCANGCGKTCSAYCTESSDKSPATCSCSSMCSGKCGTYCAGCASQCSNGCVGSCKDECDNGCNSECYGSCSSGCGSSCEGHCQFSCSSSCVGTSTST